MSVSDEFILGNSSREKDFITTTDVDTTVGQFGPLINSCSTEVTPPLYQATKSHQKWIDVSVYRMI